MRYGYVRVSTKDQNPARQLALLANSNLDKVYIEKVSGKDFISRHWYIQLKRRILKKDDVLVICSIDRLGRNYEQIIQEWRFLIDKGVAVEVLDMPILNTSQSQLGGLDNRFIADLVLQILAYVSQKERENIKERQKQGIEEAQKRGVRFGRPKKELPDNFKEVIEKYKMHQITHIQAIDLLKISRSKFFRLLKRKEK